MPHRLRLRLLADYLSATRNEIAVDEMYLRMAHVQADQVGYLPRVPRWVGRAVRAPALTRTVWRMAWLIWLAGGAIVFFALEYLKFARLQRRSAVLTAAAAPGVEEGAVLGFSTRVCDILHQPQFAGMPKVWVTMPWAWQHSLPQDARERPMLTLVNHSDLRQAFIDAVTATYALGRDAARSKWALHSYTALRWFLARRAIDRISGPLVTTEHFDRWAVLADRSIRAGRRHGAKAYNRHLVLIQHGALGGLGSEPSSRDSLLRLPVRLSCVDELYVYNATEEESFRSGVLATERRDRPLTVNYFKSVIKLSGDISSSRLRILFVGHPICEQFQTACYHELQKKSVFDAYYKPHPKAPMSRGMAAVGWAIIYNPKVFPRVDLLISYPSTLVIEYGDNGIPASVHPISITREELPYFLDQTQGLIASNIHTDCRLPGRTE